MIARINRSVALSKKIFDNAFWGKQTWLGQSKSNNVKFALSEHNTFLEVFKSVIRLTTNSYPPEKAFSKYFQERTKNCGQQLNSKDARGANQRSRTSNNSRNDNRKARISQSDQDEVTEVQQENQNNDAESI